MLSSASAACSVTSCDRTKPSHLATTRPNTGLTWFRGTRKPTVGPKKRNREDARRWCLRRMIREPQITRAVVVRHDYDGNIPVWYGNQRSS